MIDVCDGGLGGGAVWAKGHSRELGEAADACNVKSVDLEEAGFVKVTTKTFD